MFFGSVVYFSSILWIFVGNSVSFLFFVFDILKIWMAIVLLQITSTYNCFQTHPPQTKNGMFQFSFMLSCFVLHLSHNGVSCCSDTF